MDNFETIYRFFGWWIINIDSFFLLFLLIGAGLLFFDKRRWGRKFVVIACVGFAFFGIVPVGLWTVVNLENHFPKLEKIPSDAKGMILLGGSFDLMTTKARHEPSYNLTAGKLIHFVELAKANPHLILAFTGTPLEADTTKIVLKGLDLDPSHVIFENNSTNTKENAAQSARLLQPKPDEKWVLITSAYHMPRSIALFRKAGFNVIPFPVDYHTTGEYEPWFFLGLRLNLDGWAASSREWLGMVMNYIMGRSEAIFPSP
ncbi:MAG: YdcF family protein [Alphaproteobacteria bacterium]|nr:YdcF family protein [Alphaproteobacteria bacterium]